jgi:hypothetical protein
MPKATPYPVSNFRLGLVKGVEPWLSPAEAFGTADNVYLKRGQILKRFGQSVYGQIGNIVLAESVGSSGSTNYTGTLASPVAIRRSVKIYEDGGGNLVARDDGQGNLTGNVDAGGTNTIDYTTGAYDVTFSGTTSAAVEVEYHTAGTTDVRGLVQFNRVNASKSLLAFDSRRMSKWNPTFEYFDNVDNGSGTYDIWNSTNLVFTAEYEDVLYITDNDNSVGVQSYNGSSISPMTITYNAAGDEVNTCKMIFQIRERLLMLYTDEEAGNVLHPNRARWSQAGAPTIWLDDSSGKGGFNDASTNDEIIAAEFVNDILVVLFENSVWALDYTGNPEIPFTWRRISGSRDTDGIFAIAKFDDYILVVGSKGIFICDGYKIQLIDDNIPDEVLDIDSDNAELVYGQVYEAEDMALFAYPEQPSSASNNKMFAYNTKDKSFTTFTQAAKCLGTWVTGGDKTFGDYAGFTFDDLNGLTWGDSTFQGGYPILLSGGETGYVYQIMDASRSDDSLTWAQHFEESADGTVITVDLESNRLNPFFEQGFEAHLLKVQIIMNSNESQAFTVDIQNDWDSTPIVTQTVESGNNGSGDKVIKDVLVNSSAEFHRLKLYYSSAQLEETLTPRQQIRIDGFVFWFSQGGPIGDSSLG